MTRQHTTLQNIKSIVSAALVGLGIVILFDRLDGPVALLTHLLVAAAREALELLLSSVPVAWQALQVYAVDHLRFSPCLVHMLLSFWTLLHVMAGAG